MAKEVRRALNSDIPTLIQFMEEFYAESGYELNHLNASEAFSALLADERLGYVWFIVSEGVAVGYLVLTVRFGMEYGGLIACIDDLFVVPQHRNKGLSTSALIEVKEFCKEIGIRAITVEVGLDNEAAQKIYRRIGLSEMSDRQLLATALASPTHTI